MKLKPLTFLAALLLGAAATHATAQTGADPDPTKAPPAETTPAAPAVSTNPLPVPDGTDEDRLKDAARSAAGQVWTEFLAAHPSGLTVKRFAILPLQRDLEDDYVTLQLRNQFTAVCGPQGLELYTRTDAEWDSLLKEIAWGENFGDTMDAATIQKFGRVKGVEALVFPRLLGIAKTPSGGVKLRLNAQVFEIETGRQLWGREVVAEIDGTLVPLSSAPLVRDAANYREWILWGAGIAVALIVLILILRAIARASRPR